MVELTQHIWYVTGDKSQFSRTVLTLCKCSRAAQQLPGEVCGTHFPEDCFSSQMERTIVPTRQAAKMQHRVTAELSPRARGGNKAARSCAQEI